MIVRHLFCIAHKRSHYLDSNLLDKTSGQLKRKLKGDCYKVTLLQGPVKLVNNIVYEDISEPLLLKAAIKTKEDVALRDLMQTTGVEYSLQNNLDQAR